MDNVQSNEATVTTVEVVETGGEWFVYVAENGKQTIIDFQLEAFALTYAEGQRIRLRLDDIVRI